MGDVLSWQKRFQAQPRIWTVWLDGDPMGNYYDSREGAELEADFYHRNGRHQVRVVSRSIHSLELAKERWEPASPSRDSVPGTKGEG